MFLTYPLIVVHGYFKDSPIFSVSAWVKMNGLSDWNNIISKYLSGTNYISLEVGGSGQGGNDDLNFCVSNGSDSCGNTSSDFLVTGTWYFISGVYDGSQSTNAEKLKLYVNGAQQNLTYSSAIPSSSGNNSSTVKIGFITGSIYFDGQIDEVKIYNYPLTEEQIKLDHAQGAVRFE
ncbi:LamG domain-containing protein [bacterium]|nr:LamG domain-containing protein [bacterium]